MRVMSKKSIFRTVLLVLFAVFLAIQFIPVDRKNPAKETEIQAPPEVMAILRRACYDCHSSETVWPWYGRVAPFSWYVLDHVKEGREKLNFTSWNQYNEVRRQRKRHASWDAVAEGEMPMWFYPILHPAAKLTESDKAVLKKWGLAEE